MMVQGVRRSDISEKKDFSYDSQLTWLPGQSMFCFFLRGNAPRFCACFMILPAMLVSLRVFSIHQVGSVKHMLFWSVNISGYRKYSNTQISCRAGKEIRGRTQQLLRPEGCTLFIPSSVKKKTTNLP